MTNTPSNEESDAKPNLGHAHFPGVSDLKRIQSKLLFLKQWGTWSKEGIKSNKHKNSKLLQVEIVQQMPKVLSLL